MMPAKPSTLSTAITLLFRSAALFWTFCVALTWLLITMADYGLHVKETAILEARSFIHRTISLRNWVSRHGGIYVPATAQTAPNPYLVHLADRDLTLPDGRKLTLHSPASILRELQQEYADKYQATTKITSLHPLRPDNTPTPWESRALESLAQGQEEYLEFATVNGEKSLRFMQPLITAHSCLKCHGGQGYEEGDLQGGISITLPLQSRISATRKHQVLWGVILAMFWLLGLAGIWFAKRRLLSFLKDKEDAEAALRRHQTELEDKVKERTESLEAATAQLEKEIEERSRIQKALEKSHHDLQQIFNSAADGMRIVDWDFTILMCNDTFAEIAGGSRLAVEGKKCYDVLPGPQCHTNQCPLALARHTVAAHMYETTKTRRDGRQLECLVISSPFYDAQGNQLGLLETYRDISSRKALEQSLRDEASKNSRQAVELRQKNIDILTYNNELEETLRELKNTQSQMLQNEKMASVGQLAAGVAHEINNPTGFVASNLASLHKYADRLNQFMARLEEVVPAESQDEIAALRKTMRINHIREDIFDLISESLEGTERIKKIVMSLKNFSRQDQEEYGPADINDCLETTLNVVWNELKYKATVHKEYGELPHTKCFAQQLNQVFMNLLINSAQAIETQGDITIKTWAAEDRIYVAISDTGCGMDEETQAHIFEPFFTTKDKDKGTGLGLSIAYDIITKKHHGCLAVTSQPGQGTTFTLEIPVVER